MTAPDSPALKAALDRSALVTDALACAREAHAGQVRNGSGGMPYVEHPMMVAALLAEHGYGEEVVAAALLHDVVEDSETTVGELRERFGEPVAGLVAALSDDESIEDYRERKEEHRARVRRADGDALAIYGADKLTNVETLRTAFARESAAVADAAVGACVYRGVSVVRSAGDVACLLVAVVVDVAVAVPLTREAVPDLPRRNATRHAVDFDHGLRTHRHTAVFAVRRDVGGRVVGVGRSVVGIRRRVDVGVRVRGRDEAGLECRRREVHAFIEHAVEELLEALDVALRGVGVGVHLRRVGEEEAEHAAHVVGRERYARLARSVLEPANQSVGRRSEAGVEARRLEALQRGEARDHGHRIARQRARLVHGPERRDVRHDVLAAAEHADRHAAADDLAERGEIGRDPERGQALLEIRRHFQGNTRELIPIHDVPIDMDQGRIRRVQILPIEPTVDHVPLDPDFGAFRHTEKDPRHVTVNRESYRLRVSVMKERRSMV